MSIKRKDNIVFVTKEHFLCNKKLLEEYDSVLTQLRTSGIFSPTLEDYADDLLDEIINRNLLQKIG